MSAYEYTTTRCAEGNDLDKHMTEMGAQGWRRFEGPRMTRTMYPDSGVWVIRWERIVLEALGDSDER